MKIALKNMGILHEAEFEVGDLTLICGENNMGKTYAAYSFYGYLKFMHSAEDSFLKIKTADFHLEDGSRGYTYRQLEKDLKSYLDEKLQLYAKDILCNFMAGKDEDFLDTDFRLELSISSVQVKDALQAYLENTQLRKYFTLHYTLHNDRLTFTTPPNADYLHIFFDVLLTTMMPRPFILSVERTGASIFQGELDFAKINKFEIARQLLQDKKHEKPDFLELFEIHQQANQRSQIYPKPVRDNISFIRDAKRICRQSSMFKQEKEKYKAILDLLGKLVGGKYKAMDLGLFFQPKGSRSAYPLEIASSSVRSLLILNYYILHVAQKNDILMIDEPELNLHPNNQILMGRLLALLVNAGIKVFITTHSDYIVRELSNCIMLKNLKTTQIDNLRKQGYTQEYSLDSSRVRAYVAKTIKKQNTLVPVKITQLQGIFMKTFDAPIETQGENQSLIVENIALKS
ncbi:hypothetical protein NHP21005_17290 [Helicobacter sp. NHP21005]|uniref:AAA family ATPase n=1 Tax=Helicobacter felistomachi TaxID=3040201 RepID=UPI0025722A60|nr:AAA family ATPase [Helicobacter sp. NHP21005]BEG58041.1 hypothetical protein NHP21005_17290 [Helicobacter sp. NHP21005]